MYLCVYQFYSLYLISISFIRFISAIYGVVVHIVTINYDDLNLIFNKKNI